MGAQIGKLLLLLLRGTYTVDMLADTLGISRQSVKKYMRELNRAIKLMLDEMHLSDPVMSPVWMKRGPGGTLCGLRANPVWG
ncbi:MAG: HTH domain-containing protein [Acidobacteriota bacterium]|nr:HTH domain-containing protein [Acidobacteriota bacterium]